MKDISFHVCRSGLDGAKTPSETFDTFESALDRFRNYPYQSRMLIAIVYDKRGDGSGAALLLHDEIHGTRFASANRTKDLTLNPHFELAAAKAALYVNPRDAQALADKKSAEEVLGITPQSGGKKPSLKDRILDAFSRKTSSSGDSRPLHTQER